MGTIFTVVLLAGVLFVITGGVIEKHMLRKLSSSVCTGHLWRQAFPQLTKREIRHFLETVLQCFGLGDHYRLRFAPTVKLMDLYRAVEPRGFTMGVDAGELEWLIAEMEGEFDLDLTECWRDDLTLGELFRHARSRDMTRRSGWPG